MEPSSFESTRIGVPLLADAPPSRGISSEQMAAVNRLQAYWMARVGQRAIAAPPDSEFGEVPTTDDHNAS